MEYMIVFVCSVNENTKIAREGNIYKKVNHLLR
jgi:hypothetical protein